MALFYPKIFHNVGAFKGGQQATRYEVAAMVARAVARGEVAHAATKKDVELRHK